MSEAETTPFDSEETLELEGEGAAAEWVPIESVHPWPDNPRVNAHVIPEIARSIEFFGWGRPLIARKANRELSVGHTTYEAAKLLGLKKVPVRFVDWTEAKSHAYAIADNKLAEQSKWDERRLFASLKDLEEHLPDYDPATLGFVEEDLKALDRIASAPDSTPPGAQDPGAELPPPDPVSKPGEIYALGPHRLLCGDSTDQELVALLFGGEKARLVWTDPPYGVAYVGKNKKKLRIKNDAMSPEATEDLIRLAMQLAAENTCEGAAYYMASPSGDLLPFLISSVKGTGFVYHHSLVWLKDQFVLGHADYHYRHETILYGWKDDGAHFFVDDRKQDSVAEFPRPKRSEDHPTMKPVELVEKYVSNSSEKGDLVYDPFTGSGSTLIACAKQGRKFVGCELDPRYADVIRKRWTGFAKSAGIDPGSGALE